MSGVLFTSASWLADAIRRGELSSREAVEAHLRRIEAVNGALGAVVTLRAEAALAEAAAADDALSRGEPRGPLHGVPITLKDSHDTAGVVTTWGTPGRARHVPTRDASAAGRLRRAGGILLGKTNTPELTLSFETGNPVFGRTVNPWDPARTPGGSSGGAAALLAAGGTALDLGSDTGGSIRLPAHCCGIAGIKPTSGRVPRTGHAIGFEGFLQSLTTIGPMARFVEDLCLALPIVSGPDGCDPHVIPVPLRDPRGVRLAGLRVALYVDDGAVPPTPAIQDAVRASGKALEAAGCIVDERTPPGVDESFDLFMSLMTADGGGTIRLWLARCGTPPGDSSLETPRDPPTVSGDALARTFERWDRFRSRLLGFLDGFDLVMGPPNAWPALPHGMERTSLRGFAYTMTMNLTGWPACVVRAGTSPEGLPLGVQMAAHPWREDVALAAAAHVEQALGGFERPPQLARQAPRSAAGEETR